MSRRGGRTAVCLMLSTLVQCAQGLEPPGRYSHCSVVVGTRMFVYGGRGFTGAGQDRTLQQFGCEHAELPLQ